ncbi:hypothetical protein PAMP_002711 [Pampus punctatissimus]
MNGVADWLVQNKEKIEKGVEIIGQASEVLASTVGQLNPILEAVFMASAELLKNPESKEADYMKKQFNLVNEQLVGIQGEIDNIILVLKRAAINNQNFMREVQILSQYEKFKAFVKISQEYKMIKMEKFLTQYEQTDGDMNLDSLYNAITGKNNILKTIVITEKRNRRTVENFCAGLKKLFVAGIIAVMGYAALKEGVVSEELAMKWQNQMENVEKVIKAAVDDCINNFAEQAKEDMEQQLQDKTSNVNPKFTKSLLDSLIQKYDWVSWSIRAFKIREKVFFYNWLAGKKNNGDGGDNKFDILTKDGIKVVVSFCIDPKPINKTQIQEEINQQRLSRNMMSVVLSLRKIFPNYLIHAISHFKEVVETNNFDADCYYYGKHKGVYVCFHPE